MDTTAIQNEIANLSPDQLRAELEKLKGQLAKRKEASNSPEAKARRKEWYEKNRNTPEWKESRKRQADARKAKQEALLAAAREAGIDLKALGLE